jgi:hypothetical protein
MLGCKMEMENRDRKVNEDDICTSGEEKFVENESIAKGKQYVAMRKEVDTKRISEGKWSTKKAELRIRIKRIETGGHSDK